VPKETGKGGKVKKALKRSVPVDSAEAQSGGMPEETLENGKVKKSPQKLTTLANGEAAPTPPPDSEVKKKKKKKRKMANDAGPGRFLVFCFVLILVIQIAFQLLVTFLYCCMCEASPMLTTMSLPWELKDTFYW
jgi:hypothetical protein